MVNTEFKSKATTRYGWEHFGRDGALKGRGEFSNLVTTAGKNNLLDATFKSGVSTPLWYLGLVSGEGTPEFAVGDTMASHSLWTEFTDYSEIVRQTYDPGTITAGSVDNSASRAVFTISAVEDGTTVQGCFLVNNDTKSDATGVLHGAGSFDGGARPVEEGDTLRATASITEG